MAFRDELAELINRHSKENGSNTPDFILAAYLEAQLNVWDKCISDREAFHGRERTAASPDYQMFVL